jgi:hypothetical protein
MVRNRNVIESITEALPTVLDGAAMLAGSSAALSVNLYQTCAKALTAGKDAAPTDTYIKQIVAWVKKIVDKTFLSSALDPVLDYIGQNSLVFLCALFTIMPAVQWARRSGARGEQPFIIGFLVFATYMFVAPQLSTVTVGVTSICLFILARIKNRSHMLIFATFSVLAIGWATGLAHPTTYDNTKCPQAFTATVDNASTVGAGTNSGGVDARAATTTTAAPITIPNPVTVTRPKGR